MKLLAFVLLLALVHSTAAAKTRFHASGNMTCHIPGRWCVFARIFESNFLADDTIDTFGTKCFIGPSTEEYLLDGYEHGDRLDSKYTVQMIFAHSCTSHGIIKSFKSKPRDVPTNTTEYVISSDYELSVRGGVGVPVNDFIV